MTRKDDKTGKNKLYITPGSARMYLLLAMFLIALPSLSKLYKGYEGKFLVSTSQTNGSFFERTVIYIENHDLFSAHGYVINVPADMNATGLSELKSQYPGLGDVFIGGPVAVNEGFFVMHREPDAASGFRMLPIQVAEREAPDVMSMLRDEAPGYPLRVYTGYAGWTLLQLNYEVGRGSWNVIDYDPKLMFDTPPGEMWHKARQTLSMDVPAATPGRI